MLVLQKSSLWDENLFFLSTFAKYRRIPGTGLGEGDSEMRRTHVLPSESS